MGLKEQVYSVLVVSSSEQFNKALPGIFSVPGFSPVTVVSNISTAKRAFSERDFDIAVINLPYADENSIQFAIDTVNSFNTVALFLSKTEQYDETYDRLALHGVFLLQKPVARSMFEIAVSWLVSARERIRKTEKKTVSIQEKMDEIRFVNRAKLLLISELKMTEPDAHRYIEKQAMDRCISKRAVAEEIIKIYG